MPVSTVNMHGRGKYECLTADLKGQHFTGPNRYWGTIEYKQLKGTTCDKQARQTGGDLHRAASSDVQGRF